MFYSSGQYLVCILFLVFSIRSSFAQIPVQIDTTKEVKMVRPKDIFDVLAKTFRKKLGADSIEIEYVNPDSTKVTALSLLPYVNYSLVTNWAFGGKVGTYFYLNKKVPTDMSTTDFGVIYTFRHQLLVKAKSSIWTKANKYNLIGDWRFMKYPSLTYGLGPGTTKSDQALINYDYLRIYQNIFDEVSGPFYVGIGYKLDYHYNVFQFPIDFISDFEKYKEGNQKTTIASGPTLNFLYDSRGNCMNPLGGRFYGYVNYRYNSPIFGSDNSWQSLIVDTRKYFNLPLKSTNVLAFWSYNWFTFGGDPAYLDLPSTGWDDSDNQGRGYIQGRLRSNNLISFETEYRFSITRNKVFGGVVFGNVQSVSQMKTFIFDKAYPAVGLGLRLKINKLTNTNLSVDYAVGINGSRSIFFNVGEIF